ncbi:MAG: DUF3261 domain-containing protein [Proteobacteria bacterium]|nr:DUF3261 domain-containing protein [Pseudomonadota bacterium]
MTNAARRAIAVLLTLACLAGCASMPAELPEPPAGTVRIGPGMYLSLPRPGDLGRELDAAQLVAVRYGNLAYLFECRLSASTGKFSFVGLDTLGRRAMSVIWTDAGVTVEKAPWVPESLNPENILADMVLLYWPEATVRRSLQGAELQATAQGRVFLSRGKEAIRAEYRPLAADRWAGTLVFRNIAWGYELEIQSTVLP